MTTMWLEITQPNGHESQMPVMPNGCHQNKRQNNAQNEV